MQEARASTVVHLPLTHQPDSPQHEDEDDRVWVAPRTERVVVGVDTHAESTLLQRSTHSGVAYLELHNALCGVFQGGWSGSDVLIRDCSLCRYSRAKYFQEFSQTSEREILVGLNPDAAVRVRVV